jgi:hypothetical protein
MLFCLSSWCVHLPWLAIPTSFRISSLANAREKCLKIGSRGQTGNALLLVCFPKQLQHGIRCIQVTTL